jgi:hypothetical protein
MHFIGPIGTGVSPPRLARLPDWPGPCPHHQNAACSMRHTRGSPRVCRAWPPAWPSPSGPQGRQRSPRERVGPEDSFCGAGCAERLERIFGCPCGWRGWPGQCAAFRTRSRDFLTAPGTFDVRTGARPARAGTVTGGALEPVSPACGCGGSRPAAAPRPVGFRPQGAAGCRSGVGASPCCPLGSGGSPPLQLAIPLG